MLHTYQLSCYITKPTRKGKKLIDHISSNICKNKILHSDVLPCATISDYDAPYIIVNTPTNKYEIRYKFIQNLKHFDLETYINDFKTLPFANVYSFNETDDQLDTLNKLILSVIDKHAPLVKTKFTRPPASWMKDIKINNLQRKRDHWRHEAHKNPTDENWETYRESRKKIKKAIKEKKTQFYRRVLSSKNSKVHRILNPNMNALQADPSALNVFFNKTVERLVGQNSTADDDILSHIDSLKSSHDSFKLQKVTYNDVLKSLESLRNDCSTGYDNIPVSFIKPIAEYIASPLTFIINNLIEESKFPDQWKIARISPIPKVNNPTELKDYRPISILPILSKVYEKQVLHQITDFIETQQVYNKHQSGYRKNHSPATILSKLYDDIKMTMKQSELTMAVFTDYSKAFDTIDFFTLVQKMHSLNFSTDFLCWVFNYLTHRQHFMQIDSNCSSLLTAKYGVPQGSVLGPTFFNLCTADMSSITPNSNCIQYVDNSTLYRSCKINKKDTCIKELEKDLTSIAKWSIETNLVFNTSKTKFMLTSSNQLSART